MDSQKDIATTQMLKKILLTISPALLIVLNIFFFGPFTIYQGNLNEFNIPLISLLSSFVLPALLLLSSLSIIGLLLPERLRTRYVSILFAFGILIWLQGNILVWDYGVFGKGDIDWAKNTWRGWIDVGVWISLLLLAYLFYKKIVRITTFASMVMIFFQIFFLIFISIKKPQIWNLKEKLATMKSSHPEHIFEFSSKQNVIHVILDELQANIFKEILDKHPDYYQALDGFVFFEKTSGSFPTTIMSIPAILSGQIYDNKIPIKTFIDSVYRGKTILNAASDNGYDVDCASTLSWYCKGKHTNCFIIPVPYAKKYSLKKTDALLMLDTVLFRHSPHFLKKLQTRWLSVTSLVVTHEGNKRVAYAATRHFAHEAFLQDLIDNMKVSRANPTYKLIHLMTPHYPAVLNEKCEYSGEVLPWTWKNIGVQSNCSVEHFMNFIYKLKSLGIYDSSFIIMHADHGYWKIPESLKQFHYANIDKETNGNFLNAEYFAQVASSSSPFMMIKLPNAKGPLKISEAQASLTDIPTTVASVLKFEDNFSGISVFDINPQTVRERKFSYYHELNRDGDEFFNHIDQYVIKGDLFDKISWHYAGPAGSGNTALNEKPLSSRDIKDRPTMDFGTAAAHQFLRTGWSSSGERSKEGITYQWALGSSASLYIALPKNKSTCMTANVNSLIFPKPQVVTIRIDGKVIGSWTLSNRWEWQKHDIIIEPDKKRPDVSIMEFLFSEHQIKKDSRPLAVLFESITLTDVK